MEFKKSDYSLDGKVAIVTGSTRGIGLEIAKSLAVAGAKIVITGRKQDQCDSVAAEFEAAGFPAFGVATEIVKSEDRKNLVEQTVKHFGRIDILVNNAGIYEAAKVCELDEAMTERLISTDVSSVFAMTTLVSKQMIAQGFEKGERPYRIINVSSVAAYLAPMGDSVYAACKAAVAQLTRVSAKELCRYGINVTAVAPGFTVTDLTAGNRENEKVADIIMKMIPMRRYGRPEEIAEVIKFLACPASDYMTGTVVPVDGGMMLG